MNQYERRFYEDIHKLVIIQEKILKQLEKMNRPLMEDRTLDEENQTIGELVARHLGMKESE